MVLKGSFTEYPFFHLLEIFLHHRETGLLEVSSAKQSGYFYIKNGKIKDGKVGKLKGAAAVELAGSFVEASFQFRPLEQTEYAETVWEKSFGPNNLVTDIPFIRIRALRTLLNQFLTFPDRAYAILSRAVEWLPGRALPQPLFSYAAAAYRSVKKSGVLIARRTYGYAMAASEFSKRVQIRRDLVPGLQKSLEDFQVILRCTKEIVFRKLNFQLALIRERSATLPSLRQVAQSNVVFGVISVALLVGIAISIPKILRSDTNTPATREDDINAQSQAQPGRISKQNRGKLRPRTSRRMPTRKQKEQDTEAGVAK